MATLYVLERDKDRYVAAVESLETLLKRAKWSQHHQYHWLLDGFDILYEVPCVHPNKCKLLTETYKLFQPLVNGPTHRKRPVTQFDLAGRELASYATLLDCLEANELGSYRILLANLCHGLYQYKERVYAFT